MISAHVLISPNYTVDYFYDSTAFCLSGHSSILSFILFGLTFWGVIGRFIAFS
jgi:hypothetical protein